MKSLIKFSLSIVLIVFATYRVVDSELSAATLNDLYKQLESLKVEANQTQAEIDAKNKNIENNKNAIKQASANVVAKQDEILAKHEEIYQLEQEIAQKRDEIMDLFVYYQTNDVMNDKMSFIVDSSSITDSIHRASTVDRLTQKSDEKINLFLQMQDDLNKKIVQLEADIVELEALQVKLQEDIKKLEIDLDDLNEYKVSATDKISDVQGTIKYFKDLGCKNDEDLEACKSRVSVVAPTASGFVSPMQQGYITSEFAMRWGSFHAGLDMSGGATPPIFAAAAGSVGAVGYDGSRGNYVYIHHVINGQRYSTAYFHLTSRALVNVGQNVDINTVLGYMGNTGNSTGAHLHFEILIDWYGLTGYNTALARNPRNYLSYPGIMVFWSGRNR